MPAPPSKDILSDDHITAIGRLVVAVSKIDTLLTDLASAFSGASVLSVLVFVHHQQVSSKVDSLLALLKLMKSDGATKAAKLISSAGEIAKYRNTLVHAYWHIDESGNTYAVRFQARGEFKRSRQLTPASQIRLKADEADELVDRLSKLREQLLKTKSQQPQP